MVKIVYDAFGLTIGVHYDKSSHEVHWSIQSKDNKTPILTAFEIKHIIQSLQESLEYGWVPEEKKI